MDSSEYTPLPLYLAKSLRLNAQYALMLQKANRWDEKVVLWQMVMVKEPKPRPLGESFSNLVCCGRKKERETQLVRKFKRQDECWQYCRNAWSWTPIPLARVYRWQIDQACEKVQNRFIVYNIVDCKSYVPDVLKMLCTYGIIPGASLEFVQIQMETSRRRLFTTLQMENYYQRLQQMAEVEKYAESQIPYAARYQRQLEQQREQEAGGNERDLEHRRMEESNRRERDFEHQNRQLIRTLQEYLEQERMQERMERNREQYEAKVEGFREQQGPPKFGEGCYFPEPRKDREAWHSDPLWQNGRYNARENRSWLDTPQPKPGRYFERKDIFGPETPPRVPTVGNPATVPVWRWAEEDKERYLASGLPPKSKNEDYYPKPADPALPPGGRKAPNSNPAWQQESRSWPQMPQPEHARFATKKNSSAPTESIVGNSDGPIAHWLRQEQESYMKSRKEQEREPEMQSKYRRQVFTDP